MAWEDILKDPEFQPLGGPEKQQVLRGYFSEHVDTDPEFQAAASKDPTLRDQVWSGMYETIAPPRKSIIERAGNVIPFSGVEGVSSGEMPVTTPRQIVEGGLRAGVELPLFPVRAAGELAAASAGRPAAFEGFSGEVAAGKTDETIRALVNEKFQGTLDKGKAMFLGDEAGAGAFEEGMNVPFEAIGYVPKKIGEFVLEKTGDPLWAKAAEYGSLLGMFRVAHRTGKLYKARGEIIPDLKVRLDEARQFAENLKKPFAERDPAGQVATALDAGKAEAIRRGVVPPVEEAAPIEETVSPEIPTEKAPTASVAEATPGTPYPPPEVQIAPQRPQGVPETPGPLEERRATPQEGPREQRADLAARKRIDEMTPEEMRTALLTDEKTGLGNKRGFDEAPKKAVIVKSDVDGLKWINDNIGEAAGDELLKVKADVLRELVGQDAFRTGGDEFYSMFDTPEKARETMAEVDRRLAEQPIKVQLEDGTVHEFKGARFSYGIGEDAGKADAALRIEKQRREATGERSARGERPRGLVEGKDRQAREGGEFRGPAEKEVIPPAVSPVDYEGEAQRLGVKFVGLQDTGPGKSPIPMFQQETPGVGSFVAKPGESVADAFARAQRRYAEAQGPEPATAFAPEKDFRREPEEEGGPASEPVRRSDMVNLLREKFDIPIRYGKVSAGAMKGVLGIFKVKPEVIRAKFANDIETISHEIGHALQKFLYPEARNRKGLTGKPFEEFSDELLPIASKARPGQDALPEGFAEFVRRYVTDEKDAREKAPRFFSWFEAQLDEKAPEAREILLQVRADYERWLKQPAAARILGQISVGEKKSRATTFDRLYTMTLDELHPLKKITEAMVGKEKIPADQDPYKLARLLAGWQGKADNFLEHKPFSFDTYKPVEGAKSLREILAPVRDKLDDLRIFLVARRALEKAGQGVDTGILPADAKKVIADAGGKFDTVAEEFYKYMDAVLRYRLDGGLISRRQYLLMKRKNQYYASFFRVMEGEGAAGTGKGLEGKSTVKRMKGSHRDIVDPLESAIRVTYETILDVEMNAVGQALVNIPKKREGLGKYVERIPADRVPVPVYEKEILDILRKYGKWTESRQFTETGKTIRETITETGAGGEKLPPGDRGDRLMEDRAMEALTSRGWTKAEAEMILRRVKGAKTEEARNKIIERTVEKTVVLSTVRELGVEIPGGLTHIFRPSPFAPKGNVITVMEKGKPAYYEVHEDIYRTFQALDKETANALIRVLAIPARLLRAGATLTPEFMGRNPLRDQFAAFVYSKYGFIPGVDFVRGVSHMVKGSEVYWDWKKSGGEHAALVSMDREYLQKNLADLVKEKMAGEIAKTVIRHPIDSLRMLSEVGEQGTRIGEFAKGLKKEGDGKAAIQAAGFASREVTLDFQRSGAKTKAVNMLIAFWNAQVQGTDKMVREFKENPMTTTAKTVAAITIPSVILAVVNHDDPRWKEIPRWQKDLFWIVFTKDHIWRIPKPFELGILFGTLPERFVDYALTKNPRAFDQFVSTMAGGAAPGYIPTVMNPFIESFANKSTFTGRPLVPRNREDVLAPYQYQPYTTEVAKKLGRYIGKLPVVGDTGAASPAQIENLIRGWTGGLGMHALTAADKALRAAGLAPERVDPSATLSDIPFVKGFAVRYPSSDAESIQRFYDDYGKVSQLMSTARQVEKEGKYGEAVQLLSSGNLARLESVKTAIGNGHRFVEAVYANPNIQPEEKRRLIDQTYLSMIAMAQAGNAVMDGLKVGR